MSLLNLLVALNAYNDDNSTNSPTQNLVKWTTDLQGISIEEPSAKSLKLQSGQSLELFSGVVTISDDNTTTYNISAKSGSSNTYAIRYNSGTAPLFRSPRSGGHDATTQVTVTKNGPLLTFSSVAGTSFSLISGGVIVGDEVRIGDLFNLLNQGKYKILALTATSFTIENKTGAAEGPITLGSGFATQINIYSTDGVQVGDKVDLISGFSSVTLGTYEITDVSHDYIEIYSINVLPQESAIQTQLNIYNSSKQILYVESDKKLSVSVNGVSIGTIDQLKVGTKLKKAIFLKTGSMHVASITNESEETASVFFVSAE
jgi:hypothetical protein